MCHGNSEDLVKRIKEISGNWNDRRMPGGDGKIY